MNYKEPNIKGIFLINLKPLADNRGQMSHHWSNKFFKEKKILFNPRQVLNILTKSKGTIRGLHYSFNPHAESKMIIPVTGKMFWVSVDIRRNSPTYKKWDSYILEEKQNHQLWIPPGFAHGFCVISNLAVVQYKCTAPYSKTDENIIRWDDPSFNILWPTSKPILSVKDKSAPYLNNQLRLPQYEDR